VNHVKRSLEILDVVAGRGPMTVEEIAAVTGLPLSTTYRYLRTLRGMGYLAPQDGAWDVGGELLGLLRRADLPAVLGRTAAPVLTDLAVRTEETVLLTVPDGWTARCVESVPPRRPVRLSYRRGVSLPLHAGASAKPLLAHLPGRTVDEYLRSVTLGGGNRDWTALRRQLAEIRATGVCVTHAELDPDSVGIGVPVFLDRQVVACVSLAGHRTRFPGARLRETADLLRAAAGTIERTWTRGTAPAEPGPASAGMGAPA
jgi:DNA-binding IclR family transcriptional regulator